MSQKTKETASKDQLVIINTVILVSECGESNLPIEVPKQAGISKRFSDRLRRFPFNLEYSLKSHDDFNDDSLFRVGLTPTESKVFRGKTSDEDEVPDHPWSRMPLVTVTATHNRTTTTAGIILNSIVATTATFSCGQFFYEFGQPLSGLFPQNMVLENAYAKDLKDIQIVVKRYPRLESTNGILNLKVNIYEMLSKVSKSQDSDERVCDVADAEIKNMNFSFEEKAHFFLTSEKGYMVRFSLLITEKHLQAKVSFIAGPNDEILPRNYVCIFFAEMADEMCPEQNYLLQPIVNSLINGNNFVFPIISLSELFTRNLIVDNDITLKFRIIGV